MNNLEIKRKAIPQEIVSTAIEYIHIQYTKQKRATPSYTILTIDQSSIESKVHWTKAPISFNLWRLCKSSTFILSVRYALLFRLFET